MSIDLLLLAEATKECDRACRLLCRRWLIRADLVVTGSEIGVQAFVQEEHSALD